MAVDGWAVTFGTASRGLGGTPERPAPLAVPNVTHQQPVYCTVLLYNGPLLCSFNVPSKELSGVRVVVNPMGKRHRCKNAGSVGTKRDTGGDAHSTTICIVPKTAANCMRNNSKELESFIFTPSGGWVLQLANHIIQCISIKKTNKNKHILLLLKTKVKYTLYCTLSWYSSICFSFMTRLWVVTIFHQCYLFIFMIDHVWLQLEVICELHTAVLTHVRVVHNNIHLLSLVFCRTRIYTNLHVKPTVSALMSMQRRCS